MNLPLNQNRVTGKIPAMLILSHSIYRFKTPKGELLGGIVLL